MAPTYLEPLAVGHSNIGQSHFRYCSLPVAPNISDKYFKKILSEFKYPLITIVNPISGADIYAGNIIGR